MSDSKAALGAASRVKVTRRAPGSACRRNCFGAGKFWHGTFRNEAHRWLEQSADALSRLSEGAALPRLLDHVLPAPDRETALKVWPWCMWIGLARTENPDFVTYCLSKVNQQGVRTMPRRLATETTVVTFVRADVLARPKENPNIVTVCVQST